MPALCGFFVFRGVEDTVPDVRAIGAGIPGSCKAVLCGDPGAL